MRHRGAVSGLVALLLLALVACRSDDSETSTPARQELTPAAPATVTATLSSTSTPTATPTPSPTPEPTPAPVQEAGAGTLPGASGPVTELRIPSLGVASAVEAIGITNNVLDTPSNPHNTGWYSIYDRPGEGGNAVFSAHVNYYPNIIGPFNQLAALGAGAQVVVVVGGQELVYEVFSNQRYHVDSIPMGEILWPAVPPGEEWVTLITCGGEFVASSPGGPGEYLSRDVVVARRVR